MIRKKKQKNKNQACSIHITCDLPSTDGKLNVEMSYEGDPLLASYLLESAQGFINQDILPQDRE